MKFLQGLIIVFLIQLEYGCEGANQQDHNQKQTQIRNDKLQDYDRIIGPVEYRYKLVLLVRFSLLITNLVNVDTKKQTLTFDAWEVKTWTDKYLKWKPKDYGGVGRTLFNPDEIWVPDITLYNSAESLAKVPRKHVTNVYVKDSGHCLWMTPKTYTSNCKMNVKYWPIDEQVCTLTFGSWTYFDHEMRIEPYTMKNDSARVLPSNGEWEIKSIKSITGKTDHSNCCDGNYSTISYDITIARKPAYLLFYLTPPAIILGVLTLMSFFIPTESGERIGFVTTILLTMMVFLLLIPEYLPDTSDELPVLGVLMISFLILIAAVLVATIVILKCYHSQGPPSSIIRVLLCQFKSKSPAKTAVSPEPLKELCNGKDNEGKDKDATEMADLEEQVNLSRREPKPAFAEEANDNDELKWHEMSDRLNWIFFGIILIVSLLTLILVFLYR